MIQNSIRQFFLQPVLTPGLVTVNGVGIGEIMPPCLVDRPGGTGDYLLMVFFDSVQVGGQVSCPANTAVLWKPGDAQFYGTPDHCFRHTWIHCAGEHIAALIDSSGIPTNTPFQLARPLAVEHFLWDVYREMTEHDVPQPAIVCNTIHNALIELKRQLDGDRSALPVEFAALNQYMGSHLDERMTLADMAAKVHMSRSHFSREFRRYTGVSPVEYFIRLRLQTAVSLLADRNRTISEIAKEVGYDDTFLFTRQFKQRYFVSPREYRCSRQG
jgi:AraC-like DNA-binding protein